MGYPLCPRSVPPNSRRRDRRRRTQVARLARSSLTRAATMPLTRAASSRATAAAAANGVVDLLQALPHDLQVEIVHHLQPGDDGCARFKLEACSRGMAALVRTGRLWESVSFPTGCRITDVQLRLLLSRVTAKLHTKELILKKSFKLEYALEPLYGSTALRWLDLSRVSFTEAGLNVPQAVLDEVCKMVPSGAADDQAQPLRFFRALNLAPHLNLPSEELLRDARRRERVRERAACGHCERELERLLTDESIEPKPFPEQVEKQMRLPSCLGCCTLTCGSMSMRSLEGCDGQPTAPCLRPCPRLEQCSSCQLMFCEDCQDFERCRICNTAERANEHLYCSDCSFTCAMCDNSFCFDCCPDAEKCDGCQERYCGHGDCAIDDEGLLDFWTKKGNKNFCHGCAQCIRWEIRCEEEEGRGTPVEWTPVE